VTPSQPILPLPALCICGNFDCPIPFGYCHCGCGQKTNLATRTSFSEYRVCYMPVRFCHGHQGRIRPFIEDAKPFKLDGVYCRLIPLTQGQHTIVWESDYCWLMQWKWYARLNPGMGAYYASRKEIIKGRMETIQMHRQILGLEVGDLRIGDHIQSGETLLNTRSNLRIATFAENGRNHRMRVDNTSGFIGVRIHKRSGLYVAFITVNNILTYLGYRKTAEAAWRELYVPAALKYHGEFARIA